MKFLPLLFVMLCGAMIASAQKADTLFFEDFKGTTLNREIWNVEQTNRPSNNEQQAYADSAGTIIIDKGLLTIKPKFHAAFSQNRDRPNDFVSGRINTRNKYEFVHGNITAKMRTTAGAGLWPAFWLLGNGRWPDAGEVDIMETVGDPTWVSHALHGPNYFGNTPLVTKKYFSGNNDVTQWHTYGANILPDKIVFSIDGVETYTVTKAMVEKYGNWVFDNNKYILLNFALGGGYPQGVNKINEPYPGISQSSVDMIKSGKALFEVDWVLVTKN